LIAGLPDGHGAQQKKRKDELGQGNDEGEAANPQVIVAAKEQKREGAKRGKENENGEKVAGVRH
jgi:hypothetical protein